MDDLKIFIFIPFGIFHILYNIYVYVFVLLFKAENIQTKFSSY